MTDIDTLLKWTLTSDPDKDIVAILDYRVFQGKVQYLVRRKSQSFDNWEDSSGVYASNLIVRFWEGKSPLVKPVLKYEEPPHSIPNQINSNDINTKDIEPMAIVRFIKSYASEQSISFLVIEPNELTAKTMSIDEVKAKYPLELVEYFEKSLLNDN